MKGLVCSVLTMIFGMTVACKLQSTHSEGKFGSKLARGASKGADDLTAVRKLINKSNKTKDEWNELAEAVKKGGAKGDAVVRSFAERINKNRLTINALVDKIKPNKIEYEQLATIRRKIANEFNELADNLADNVSLMERVFPYTNMGFTFNKRAEIFAKLHPGGDNHSTALKAFNSLHDSSKQISMYPGYEVLATREGVRSDAYRLFSEPYERGLSGKTLVERQIKALFSPLGETHPLAKMENNIHGMKQHQHLKGQEDLQNATSRQYVSEIKLTFREPIKSIGGKDGLTNCCGQYLVETLREASIISSKSIRFFASDTSPTFTGMADNIADELENIAYILQ